MLERARHALGDARYAVARHARDVWWSSPRQLRLPDHILAAVAAHEVPARRRGWTCMSDIPEHGAEGGWQPARSRFAPGPDGFA